MNVSTIQTLRWTILERNTINPSYERLQYTCKCEKKTVCFDNSTCRLYSVIVQLKVHAVLKLPVGDSN